MYFYQLIKLRKELSPEEKELILESDTGIHMFYDLKHCAPDGRNIKHMDVADSEGYFIQITNEEFNSHLKLKAGSLILVYKV